jgi:hypothetical protein
LNFFADFRKRTGVDLRRAGKRPRRFFTPLVRDGLLPGVVEGIPPVGDGGLVEGGLPCEFAAVVPFGINVAFYVFDDVLRVITPLAIRLATFPGPIRRTRIAGHAISVQPRAHSGQR